MVIAVSTVVYAVSFLLTRLLSRYRELSADRSAALQAVLARGRRGELNVVESDKPVSATAHDSVG